MEVVNTEYFGIARIMKKLDEIFDRPSVLKEWL